MKTRLDRRLVEEGLAPTRTRAEALIRTGRVLVDDVPVEKPGTAVKPEARLRVRGDERRFVSRGGDKLAGAFEDLGVDPRDRFCLDVGASTGGFTDCLLQAGAARVLALDVGYGQLALGLRRDPRVEVAERTNVRHYQRPPGAAPFDLVVADLSFISLRLVLPRLFELVRPGGKLLVLVKPQFELERAAVGSGGVVRAPEERDRAVLLVREAAERLGFGVEGEAESVLAGPKGNRERFLLLARPA